MTTQQHKTAATPRPKDPNGQKEAPATTANIENIAPTEDDDDTAFDFGGITEGIDLKKNLGCGG